MKKFYVVSCLIDGKIKYLSFAPVRGTAFKWNENVFDAIRHTTQQEAVIAAKSLNGMHYLLRHCDADKSAKAVLSINEMTINSTIDTVIFVDKDEIKEKPDDNSV